MNDAKENRYALNERSLFLFKSLVEHFIQDGQPVGSRTLARDMQLNLSPATIRNVMADLEDVGLLHSPHTSAGRVPTVKGYRLFVDSMLRLDCLQDKEVQHIAEQLGEGNDMKGLMEKTSTMLSEITSLAGVVMLPRASQKTALHQIEFVALGENRILVILVMSNNEVQNRIIHTDRTFKQAELQEAANYLNSTFSGKHLDTVRVDLLAELQQVKEDVNTMMQTAIEMASKAFSEPANANNGDDFVMSGQTNLMGVADLGDLDKLKRLFDSFNQKRDVLHILENSIQAKGVQIFIGEESGYEVMDDCSVVTSPYEVEGESEIVGVLGVIGPTRMDYERVIPIVDITAKMLGSVLKSNS